jgi:hypothetical protein
VDRQAIIQVSERSISNLAPFDVMHGSDQGMSRPSLRVDVLGVGTPFRLAVEWLPTLP